MRLDESECRRRFAAAPVAVLGTVSGRGVDLVPVVFAVRGDRIVFAVDHKAKTTTELARLANVEIDPRVTLLTHGYEDDWAKLWWVRVRGAATVVRDEPARRDAIADLVARYAPYHEQPPLGPAVVIEATGWWGWAAAPGTPGTDGGAGNST